MKKITTIISAVTALSLGAIMTPVYAAGDKAAGQTKSSLCAGCHGENGISFAPNIPNLAGQKEVYLVSAIKDYRAGKRKNPMMLSMVEKLSDQDIEDLAAYYTSLKP